MTPHSPSHRVRASRTLVRRAATFLAAAAAVSAAPLTAQAQDEAPVTDRVPQLIVLDGKAVFQPAPVRKPAAEPDSAAAPAQPATEPPARSTPEATPAPAEPAATPVETATTAPAEAAAPEPVDPTVALLTAGYAWDERSPRVEALQQQLGVTVDGWYGQETAGAHRAALELAELPIDTVPEPVLPPGPSAGAWAALRDCESGGDYTITNPSGTYRGAYQFNRSTWDSVAGRNAPRLVGVDPAAASPADQDAMALALWHESGASPWPHCGRHLR